MKNLYSMLICLSLMFLLSCGSGSGPVSNNFTPTVGPLREDRQYMEGQDHYCARHIPGKTTGCWSCHEVI